MCICDAPKTGKGHGEPTCSRSYPCCGVTHTNGDHCTCVTDEFLSGKACDEWFGPDREAVSSCPPD